MFNSSRVGGDIPSTLLILSSAFINRVCVWYGMFHYKTRIPTVAFSYPVVYYYAFLR